MNLTIYHNPRCSKSRQTLKLLTDRGLSPDVVKYLDTPPSADQISEIVRKLSISPRELLRKGEAIYKELDLGRSDATDAEIVEAMAAHPILIERPIVVTGGGAALGRPPENVLKLLD